MFVCFVMVDIEPFRPGRSYGCMTRNLFRLGRWKVGGKNGVGVEYLIRYTCIVAL